MIFISELAEGPGVARGKKPGEIERDNVTSKATHECPQKNSAHSVQLFGRLYGKFIYESLVLLFRFRGFCY